MPTLLLATPGSAAGSRAGHEVPEAALVALGIAGGSFALAWGAGALCAFSLPHGLGWGRLYFICAVFYGGYLFLLRQWLVWRAGLELSGKVEIDRQTELAAVSWWATRPVGILVLLLFSLALAGTLSMLR